MALKRRSRSFQSGLVASPWDCCLLVPFCLAAAAEGGKVRGMEGSESERDTLWGGLEGAAAASTESLEVVDVLELAPVELVSANA